MNENVEILNTLAEKFGTTVEHLWHVLLFQANIAVVEQVTILVFLTVLMYLTYRGWKYGTNKVKKMDEGMEMEDIGLLFPMALAFILIEILFIALGIDVSIELVTLIFNPEYWALQQIVNPQ